MAKVAIRTATAEKNIVLAEHYSLDAVVAAFEEASSAGERVLMFDLDRGGKVAISVGGTEPFTIREVNAGRVI